MQNDPRNMESIIAMEFWKPEIGYFETFALDQYLMMFIKDSKDAFYVEDIKHILVFPVLYYLTTFAQCTYLKGTNNFKFNPL